MPIKPTAASVSRCLGQAGFRKVEYKPKPQTWVVQRSGFKVEDRAGEIRVQHLPLGMGPQQIEVGRMLGKYQTTLNAHGYQSHLDPQGRHLTVAKPVPTASGCRSCGCPECGSGECLHAKG